MHPQVAAFEELLLLSATGSVRGAIVIEQRRRVVAESDLSQCQVNHNVPAWSESNGLLGWDLLKGAHEKQRATGGVGQWEPSRVCRAGDRGNASLQ